MKQISAGMIVLMALGSASCGSKESGSKSKGWTVTNLADSIVELEKADTYCPLIFSSATYSEASFVLTRLMDGVLAQSSLSFSDQLRGNYVESRLKSPIKETMYGKMIDAELDVTYDKYENAYLLTPDARQSVVEADPRKLNVCPSTSSYEAFTFEGSGLSISYSINKTYQAVTAVSDIELDPVTVQVAPVIKKHIKYRGGPANKRILKGYDADNAFYNPKEKEITFLPQSEMYQKKVSKVPFWQIPMVGSHEYGHHIFQSVILDKTSSEIQHPKSCFENVTTLRNLEHQQAFSRRDNSANYAMGSLNEGFADLISFYTLSNQERALKNVKCFTGNREVDATSFGDGTPKIFNTMAMSIIDSSIVYRKDRDCDTPDYQDTHHAGAIFAHIVDKVMNKVSLDKEKKLEIILSWAKLLAAEYEYIKELDAGEFLFKATEMALLSIANKVETVSYQCSDLKEYFPSSRYECSYL